MEPSTERDRQAMQKWALMILVGSEAALACIPHHESNDACCVHIVWPDTDASPSPSLCALHVWTQQHEFRLIHADA
jgi:hypothetical protein